MGAFVNRHLFDEQQISVRCSMPGCEKRIHRATRCRAHGGDPDYEWSTDPYGDTHYSTRRGSDVSR